MASFTPSLASGRVASGIKYTGSVAGTDAREVFLKIFSGEVLNAFNRKTIMFGSTGMNGKTRFKQIQSGKSAQFVLTGRTKAAYKVPGEGLDLQSFAHGDQTIVVDNMLTSTLFVDDFEEAMMHWMERSELAEQMGEALATTGDEQLYTLLWAAAADTAPIPGHSGGAVVVSANSKTDGQALGSAIFDAAQNLDEAHVPEMSRYAIMAPAQYNLLVQGTTLAWTNSVINKDVGGMGSVAMGTVQMVAGIPVYKAALFPSGLVNQTVSGTFNAAANADLNMADIGSGNTYDADFSNTAALVFHKDAVGTVQLRGLKMQSDYLTEYLGTIMVASYAMGHGVLRPECAVSIDTAAR